MHKQPFSISYVEKNYQKVEKISWSSVSNAVKTHEQVAHLDTFDHVLNKDRFKLQRTGKPAFFIFEPQYKKWWQQGAAFHKLLGTSSYRRILKVTTFSWQKELLLSSKPPVTFEWLKKKFVQ